MKGLLFRELYLTRKTYISAFFTYHLITLLLVLVIPTQQEELTGKGRFYVVYLKRASHFMWCSFVIVV